jgi:hypothetical protein
MVRYHKIAMCIIVLYTMVMVPNITNILCL